MRAALRSIGHALPVFVVLLLAACAGDVNLPTTVKRLDTVPASEVRLTAVSTEAAQGVEIIRSDLDRITELLRMQISTKYPNALTAPVAGNTPARLKVVLTRYDEGSAIARAMLAGLGQIRIEGDVFLLAGDSETVLAQYTASKTFAWGGIYGGTTTIRDVEKGFFASVVEVLVHDPLYKWGISEEKKKKSMKGGQQRAKGQNGEGGVDDDDNSDGNNDPVVAISITNADAERALLRVRNKLAGLDAGDGEARGIRAQVRQLLADAADPALLCRMYVGWAAWV